MLNEDAELTLPHCRHDRFRHPSRRVLVPVGAAHRMLTPADRMVSAASCDKALGVAATTLLPYSKGPIP
jgi:hypothetical protein